MKKVDAVGVGDAEKGVWGFSRQSHRTIDSPSIDSSSSSTLPGEDYVQPELVLGIHKAVPRPTSL